MKIMITYYFRAWSILPLSCMSLFWGHLKKKILNACLGNLIRKGTHVDTYKQGGACCQEVKIRPISILISGGGAQIVASLATWSGPWRTRGGEGWGCGLGVGGSPGRGELFSSGLLIREEGSRGSRSTSESRRGKSWGVWRALGVAVGAFVDIWALMYFNWATGFPYLGAHFTALASSGQPSYSLPQWLPPQLFLFPTFFFSPPLKGWLWTELSFHSPSLRGYCSLMHICLLKSWHFLLSLNLSQFITSF